MSFQLTEIELQHAFDAIQHHGYSAMLPEPPEWAVVRSNWLDIKQAISRIDLDTYVPYAPLQVFSPKNRANVRVLHLLHPQDLLIYTSLTLIAKSDIENHRVSTRSKRVFSYRASAVEGELYNVKGAYNAYRKRLSELAARDKFKYVGVADIADFYARIYQHRLENVIESVASCQRVRDVARVLVRKLIGNLLGKNSYGIPVGPYASRILAEALLIDIDAHLVSDGTEYARWVDDFVVFSKSEYEAQSTLFRLGEELYTKHGLTLQSAKTSIFPIAEFRQQHLLDHDESLTGRDAVIRMLREAGDDYDSGSEPTEEEIADALATFQSEDVVGILRSSMQDTSLVDYQAVTYALTKIPRIPGSPPDLKRNILDLITDNAELLYPVAEHVAYYVLSFDDLTASERRNIARKLLKPLQSRRKPPPPSYAMWILHIFASGSEWNHAPQIMKLYNETRSEVVKRAAALAIQCSGSRAQAVTIRDDYSTASPLLRLAVLLATHKLGADERRHWKTTQSISGVVDKAV